MTFPTAGRHPDGQGCTARQFGAVPLESETTTRNLP
jgi:hypothetical protein